MSQPSRQHPSDWTLCRDAEHGFALWHPPDWQPAGPPGRCVQLQRGDPSLPDAPPEVDVFLRVLPLEGDFPSDYLQPGRTPREQHLEVGRGVSYSDRSDVTVGGLPAVRARFRSSGPAPNWGVEYAISKGNVILDAYISQPRPDIEADFDRVIATLEW
jgi:hypothetical protein